MSLCPAEGQLCQTIQETSRNPRDRAGMKEGYEVRERRLRRCVRHTRGPPDKSQGCGPWVLIRGTRRPGAERPPGGAAEPGSRASPLPINPGGRGASGNVCIYSVAGVQTSYIEGERQRETAAEIPPSL